MIKPHYILLAFITALCSCKGNNEKNAEPLPADSVNVISEQDTAVVTDFTLTDDHSGDSLTLPITEVQETNTCTAHVEPKTSKAYDEGYDNGYEDGYEDGVDRNGYQSSYDESCHYRVGKMKDYEEGYEEGYEDGYSDGKADISDNPDVDDEYD